MDNWIPFTEGEYLVEQALLVSGEDRAVSVEDVIVEVYSVFFLIESIQL